MPEPDYTSNHLRAVDNDECARKKFTSRKLKAKMVMQAVVVSILLFDFEVFFFPALLFEC